MIGSSHIKVHPHVNDAVGCRQDMKPYKMGLNTKIHPAADANCMPVKIFTATDTLVDHTQMAAALGT